MGGFTTSRKAWPPSSPPLPTLPSGWLSRLPLPSTTSQRASAWPSPYFTPRGRGGARRCGRFLSGISEPIGGLIGWLVFAKSDLHPLAYGVMFSLVAGMMVFISLHELLPTALQYDPKNQFVTFSLVGGMVIMALSLLLFDI